MWSYKLRIMGDINEKKMGKNENHKEEQISSTSESNS